MDSISVSAPAKINLSLDILGKRNDGYHDVKMVMQAVSLCDTIKVKIDKDGSSEIYVSCDDPLVPADDKNIVYKATNVFYERLGIKDTDTYIEIEKKIPMQAGLAGGSTDAAAVILALNFLFDTNLKTDDMADIASYVGSDVPFCLYGGTMIASGRGTILKKTVSLPKCSIVIVKPDVSVSTKEAYDRCDSRMYKQFVYSDEVIKKICERNLRGVCDLLYNEFEEVMQIEEINNIKKSFIKNKALGSSMTGSGSAVYGIFLNEKKAKNCIEKMKDEYENIYLCEPLKDGCRII